MESGQTLTVLWGAGLLQNDVLCGGFYTTEIVSGPSSGWLTDGQAIQGSFQYTPEAGFGKFFEEYDCFTYALLQDDVEYGQAEACIRVDFCTIVAAADVYPTPYETALTVPAPGLLANDTNHSVASPYPPCNHLLKVHPAPSHGTLTVDDNGAFEYYPDAGYSGVDAFGYILHLGIGHGGTTEATFHQNYLAIGTVTIIVGDPECAVDDSAATSVNEPQTTVEPGVVDSDALCANP